MNMQRKGNPEHAQELKNTYVAAIQAAKKPGQTRDLTGGNMQDEKRPAFETA